MSLPGMKSTADFATDERPKNWREGIMLLEPRNGASLYRLTAAMKQEPTDDPEFYWWEEETDMLLITVNGAQTNVETAIEIDAYGTRLKAGDHLFNPTSGEVMAVASVTSDTVINVTRAVGPGGSPAGTAAVIADNEVLIYIGSAYREGAPIANGVSFNPVKKTNLTQIFRDPVEWTRTAMKTRLRTGDAMKEDRRRALHKHALGIERMFWMGTKHETLESGQPKRYTQGVLGVIDAGNVKTVQGVGGALDMDELMSYFPLMFAYGSGEKLGYVGLGTMVALGEVVRKNSQYNIGPTEKMYGMNVKRFETPAGVLVLTEHPAFNNNLLKNSLVVLDTANLKYRYITDTTLLKDREQKGMDGKADEYLTEAGLEIGHPKTHFWLKGIVRGAADN